MVSPESLFTVHALTERIGKASNMPGCDKNVFNPYGRALDFHMPFLDNVKFSPDLLDAPLQRAPERSIIVKATAPAVQLK
ncbi:hypothetical protein SDC9_111041 [bioreactor metagenome]|uniref:Uncharacterized protein n=1 Tax=bioreactor metagenome TaxID=1076179 RepID=A0A645BFC6_9ZZZZ